MAYHAMTRTACILILLFPLCLFGQYVEFHGSVLDQDGHPLVGANVYVSNDFGAYTDNAGLYAFLVPADVLAEGDTLLVHATYIGFGAGSVQVAIEGQKKIEVSFSLMESSFLLETVTVSTTPQVKFASPDEWILDFVFEGDGLMILTRRGSSIYLKYQDEIENIVQSVEIPHAAFRLERSCMGDLHVIGESLCTQVAYLEGSFILVDHYEAGKFTEVIEPCNYHTEHGELIFGHYHDFNQSIMYRQFATDGKIRWQHHVFQEEQVEYAYDEFRRLLKVYEQQVTARDGNAINYDFPIENVLENNNWEGDLMDLVIDNRTMKYVSYFSNIVTKEIYAPLFVYRGEVVIFDQLNEFLVAYQLPEMDRSRKVPLQYISEYGAVKEILQDVRTEKIYAKMTSGKNLKLLEINPFDGKTIHAHTLPTDLHFETRLKMRDGILYYLAQEHANKPHKRIYQQKVL